MSRPTASTMITPTAICCQFELTPMTTRPLLHDLQQQDADDAAGERARAAEEADTADDDAGDDG